MKRCKSCIYYKSISYYGLCNNSYCVNLAVKPISKSGFGAANEVIQVGEDFCCVHYDKK